MARLMQDQHYVNFLRGTPAAWERLENKDPDTLYFISEKNAPSGQLYLGNKIIAGSIENLTLEIIAGLNPDAMSNGQVLVYDNDQWTNKNISELLSLILKIMKGASSTSDGASGLVPIPKQGDQNKFLRGDGTWASYQITETDIANILSRINSNLYWDNF